jgi:alpha-1,6-mannosyltransferase
VKIVDVSGFYSEKGGGVRSYVHQKLAAAAVHGHDVTIIAPGDGHRVETRPGGKIVWVPAPLMPFDANYHVFRESRDAMRVLDAEQPDVVEGSSTWRGGWIAAEWSGDCVRSLVFHQDFVAAYAHTFLDRYLSRSTLDRLFWPYWHRVAQLSSHFDVTVAGGDWLANRLASFGIHNPVAVPLGIDTGRFSPSKRDPSLRADLLRQCGVGDDGKLLIAVGRFHPEKRHGVIIDGFARAKNRNPGMGLVLLGDGLTRKSVERAARRTGNVHLAGAITDRDLMARIYASADAMVHGSGAETYGLVVAEAICSGLPVVIPDIGGASDFAGRGRTEVYRTGDAAACAEAILRILSPGEGRAPASPVAERPINSAESHFTALFALYQGLLDNKVSFEMQSRKVAKPKFARIA